MIVFGFFSNFCILLFGTVKIKFYLLNYEFLTDITIKQSKTVKTFKFERWTHLGFEISKRT